MTQLAAAVNIRQNVDDEVRPSAPVAVFVVLADRTSTADADNFCKVVDNNAKLLRDGAVAAALDVVGRKMPTALTSDLPLRPLVVAICKRS